MAKVLGRVTIKVDGVTVKSKPGSTLTRGGRQRTPQVGDNEIHGASETLVPPELTVTITQTKEVTLETIEAIEEATILFEGDDGVSYVLDKAFSTTAPTLNSSNGEIRATFSAIACHRVG